MKKVHLKDACSVTSSSRRHASHSDIAHTHISPFMSVVLLVSLISLVLQVQKRRAAWWVWILWCNVGFRSSRYIGLAKEEYRTI